MAAPTLFHSGELDLQERAGVREQVAAFSQRALRRIMPEQHREFFRQLPFMVAGVVDAEGRPWATLLSGLPGFVQSPTDTTLVLTPLTAPPPPLAGAWRTGAAVGLLGIELSTRRRNRANGVIVDDQHGWLVNIQESFGNCPKYIQTRQLDWHPAPPAPVVELLPALDAEAKALIAGADTFFVASYADEADGRRVDVSHRGGPPGFVRQESDTAWWVPDFTGNFLFCTLGNFLRVPRAGLVFVDFACGDLLHLSGRVELLWAGTRVSEYPGAVHAWRFRVDDGFWWRNALPFSAGPGQHSPFLAGLGPWRNGGEASGA